MPNTPTEEQSSNATSPILADPRTNYGKLYGAIEFHAPTFENHSPPDAVHTPNDALKMFEWMLATMCHWGANPRSPVTTDPIPTFRSGPDEWVKELWEAVRTWDGDSLNEDDAAIGAADSIAGFLKFRIAEMEGPDGVDRSPLRDAMNALNALRDGLSA